MKARHGNLFTAERQLQERGSETQIDALTVANMLLKKENAQTKHDLEKAKQQVGSSTDKLWAMIQAKKDADARIHRLVKKYRKLKKEHASTEKLNTKAREAQILAEGGTLPQSSVNKIQAASPAEDHHEDAKLSGSAPSALKKTAATLAAQAQQK